MRRQLRRRRGLRALGEKAKSRSNFQLEQSDAIVFLFEMLSEPEKVATIRLLIGDRCPACFGNSTNCCNDE